MQTCDTALLPYRATYYLCYEFVWSLKIVKNADSWLLDAVQDYSWQVRRSS